MYRTFNCGIGMVGIVPRRNAERVLAELASHDERAWVIGEVVKDEAQRVHIA
jgi:phosphoribosylformylglycinamidine cyclo-ligase